MAEAVSAAEIVQGEEPSAPATTNAEEKESETPVEDVGMDNSEEDKKQRACRQST